MPPLGAGGGNLPQEGAGQPYFMRAILHRLEEEGLIKGSWSKEGGRRRKVYKLTGTGERHLSGETDRVQEIVSRLMLVLRRPGEAPA